VNKVIVVGGGHAAAQFCVAMAGSAEHSLTLVSNEAYLPYQRPPLSKTYMKDEAPQPAWIKPETFYTDHGINTRLSTEVSAIDRSARQVVLRSGERLDYDTLVLATGTRARTLPAFEAGYANVHTLRNLDDAQRMREQLATAERVLVVGGGFIGLELAATAVQLGKHVTVLEAASRLLGRSASPEVSDYLLLKHRQSGVDIRLQTVAERIEAEEDKVNAVWAANERFAADVVVLGIGAQPNTELAEQAGLDCDNGVVVNASMQTTDPHIYAVGDCTAFPSVHLGRALRLESVQNANDQARCAAQALLGDAKPYDAMPWFWSDQGGVRIQIAGVPDTHHERVMRGDPATDKFSVLYFDGDVLTCVESINLPADHLAARKLIAAAQPVNREQAADPAVPLKNLG
jgi:3-phenylpropionate/trans-cinnamate dioxygenase ferredoxin reductase subunit